MDYLRTIEELEDNEDIHMSRSENHALCLQCWAYKESCNFKIAQSALQFCMLKHSLQDNVNL